MVRAFTVGQRGSYDRRRWASSRARLRPPHGLVFLSPSWLAPVAPSNSAAAPYVTAPPSQTQAAERLRPPSAIDMPTMRRPPSAPLPPAGPRPLLSPPQSGAPALLPCDVFACLVMPPRIVQKTDGLGASVTADFSYGHERGANSCQLGYGEICHSTWPLRSLTPCLANR